MAKTKDTAADKARKQKIILAVAGVLMVGLAVIQGPKLLKKDSPPAAAPPAATASGTATPGYTAPASATGAPTTVTKPGAYVAGVALPGTSAAVVTTSKLASFTLFEPKDPFVQQVGDETGIPAVAAAVAPAADQAAASGGAAAKVLAAKAPAAKAVPVTYATVMFNGVPQQLQLKQKFPEVDPTFVLASLKKQQAKIGVVGGTFGDGKSLTLVLGQNLTLVNTATGVRYVLKLVYTGTAPEQIESFSTGDSGAAAPAGDGSAAATPPASTPPVEGAPTATPGAS